MSFTTWTPHAVLSEAFNWQGQVWRMVESQHIASTMKLVDNRDEQDILESLLESSKPLLRKEQTQLDFLLATPFRYSPKRGGSRFRSSNDAGVFYGAESVRTAAAELGYWRWKFLQDAISLDRIEPVAHTAFRADIHTNIVDLQRPPFNDHADVWLHRSDYNQTQQFARVVREAGVGGIRYQSVRDPQPSWCFALLTPTGFAKLKPYSEYQTWYLVVSKNEVTFRNGTESMAFSALEW